MFWFYLVSVDNILIGGADNFIGFRGPFFGFRVHHTDNTAKLPPIYVHLLTCTLLSTACFLHLELVQDLSFLRRKIREEMKNLTIPKEKSDLIFLPFLREAGFFSAHALVPGSTKERILPFEILSV